MRETILLNRIAQRLNHMILTQHIFKSAGTILSRENLVGLTHGIHCREEFLKENEEFRESFCKSPFFR
jgi:hypothetical protein